MLSPERWRQIEEIFQAAIDLPEAQRSLYLQRRCDGDQELRREVESLLGYDQPPTHLEDVIQGAAVQVAQEFGVRAAGQRIGQYEVVEPLGRGGMGTVYLAVRADDVYRKKVAIKIVKRGMDTEFVLSRFRHERQILAGLEHPNIAALLDGGTTEEGLPYFVMEYVPGKPITTYCNEKNLSTHERLQLYRQVCAAVQYAHQNLIVHRDLKPGNILVTADGTPKLLDFGIAKMLNDDGVSTTAATQTMTGMRMLTPEYASPEQIKGEAVTTASDVYSLGVILFELLAGKRPYQFRNYNPGHVLELVCETNTERPSTVAGRLGAARLRRQLAGDLDNIVLMAMRKEPERRYQSVERLSADVQRHLDGRPVMARKDTLRYRMGKFIQRNKLAVTACVLLLATLVGGIVATAYQYRVAARRFEQVRHLANSFLFEFHDSIAPLPGSMKARALVVQKGLEYLDALASEAGRDPALQQELARAYQKVGDVQGNPTASNIGDSAGARKSYQRAVDILEALHRRFPANDEYTRRLTEAYTKLGPVLRTVGGTAAALEAYLRAETLAEALQASNPSHATLRELAGIHGYKARTLIAMGKVEESLAATRRALAINLRLLEVGVDRDDVLSEIATTHSTLGVSHVRLKQLAEAVAEFRKSVQIRETLAARNPGDKNARRQLMIAYSHLGDALGSPTRTSLNDQRGAIEILTKMLQIAEELAAQDENDRRVRMDLMFSLQRVANVMSEIDRAAALQQFRRALRIGEEILTVDARNSTLRLNIAFVLDRIASIEDQSGAIVPALSAWRRAVGIADELLREDPADQDVRLVYLDSAGKYAVAQARTGNRAEALQFPAKLEKLALELVKDNAEDRRHLAQVPLARRRAGEVFEWLAGRAVSPEIQRKDTLAAIEWYRRSRESWEPLVREGKVSGLYTAEPGWVNERLATLLSTR